MANLLTWEWMENVPLGIKQIPFKPEKNQLLVT